MTFKIKKITYDDGKVEYYPMIKKRFWSKWDYLYLSPIGFKLPTSLKWIGWRSKADANTVINKYKSDNNMATTISTGDILIG